MFVIPGISASSSSATLSSASSPSSSQESTSADRDSVSNNRGVETPVSERSGGSNEELRREPLRESTETENHNKNKESKEVQRDISHELPDWLQEFRDNLVDESTSEELRRDPMQRSADTSSSSHEPPMESRAYAEPGSGKHSVFFSLPERSEIARSVRGQKITRARAEDALVQSCPERNSLVIRYCRSQSS